MKKLIAVQLLGVSFLAFNTGAMAAAPANACTYAAMVQGGGLLDGGSLTFPGGFVGNTNWLAGFGEGALAASCGTFGIQLDGAVYGFGGSGNNSVVDFTDTNTNSHFGGEVFWRNPEQGAFGVAASRITQTFSESGTGLTVKSSSPLWRTGLFGEYYGGDRFTFGGGAYYLSGDLPSLGWTQDGFEGDIYAKYYVSNNVALNARADLMAMKFHDVGFSDTDWHGAAVSADAENLIPNSAFSIFAGGRYASRDSKNGTFEVVYNDLQGFVGAKIEFGGPNSASLRDRDRHGTFDNTSVMQEKLPSWFSEAPFD